MRRRFGGSREFLDFVSSRGSLAIAGGSLVALVGALLFVLLPDARPGAFCGILAGAGLLVAYAGARARWYAAQARATLERTPQALLLSTYPYRLRGARAVERLQAVVVPDPKGAVAAFKVRCGSFGTTRVDDLPANVYGTLAPGSIALVACGEGFAFGRVERSSSRLPPDCGAQPPQLTRPRRPGRTALAAPSSR
jgi:hypothetical protein